MFLQKTLLFKTNIAAGPDSYRLTFQLRVQFTHATHFVSLRKNGTDCGGIFLTKKLSWVLPVLKIYFDEKCTFTSGCIV